MTGVLKNKLNAKKRQCKHYELVSNDV